MNKLLSILILIHCFMSGIRAQQDTIALAANWKLGDTQRYTMVQERFSYTGDSLVRMDTMRYVLLDFTVLDSLEDMFEISCLNINGKLLDHDPSGLDPAIQALLEQFGKITCRYTTDGSGSFLWLDNADEIDAFVDSLFSNVHKDLFETDTAGFASGILALMKENAGGGFSGLFLPEIERFHFPYGFTYIMGDTLYYEDEAFIPQFGATVAMQGSLWIDHIDHIDNTCIIKHRVVPDPEALSSATKAFFRNTILSTNLSEREKRKRIADMEAELGSQSILSIDTFAEYHMDHASGWPLSISIRGETKINDGQSHGILVMRYNKVL